MYLNTIYCQLELYFIFFLKKKETKSHVLRKVAGFSNVPSIFVELSLSAGIGLTLKWDKVFKNGPSKICGRQPLKNLKGQ